VALLRTDVSEERSASIIMVTRIGEMLCISSLLRLLVTADVVPGSPILITLMMEVLHSSEISALKSHTE
jgi:hypothetical protein